MRQSHEEESKHVILDLISRPKNEFGALSIFLNSFGLTSFFVFLAQNSADSFAFSFRFMPLTSKSLQGASSRANVGSDSTGLHNMDDLLYCFSSNQLKGN